MHRLTDKFFFTLDLVGFKCFKLTKLGIAMSHLVKEKLVSQHPAQICFEYQLILPTFNALSYTRSLLDSLSETNAKDIELIIINDASTDGTREYLGR